MGIALVQYFCAMSTLNDYLARIESFKLEHPIVRQVINQIQKDFDDIAIEVELEDREESPYEQLRKQLRPVIDWLMEKRPERLFALFYRIDIPEQTVKRIMTGGGEGDVVEQCTDLILQRELQKVIVRNYYSQVSSSD